MTPLCATRRIQISKSVIKDLKSVSRLSSKNRWEYGGKVKYDKCMNYKGLTYVTSKERARLDASVLESEWSDAPVAYHTHPSLLQVIPDEVGPTIFTTLPSDADFESFIKGFPDIQVNIICDARGYYVIDIFDAIRVGTVPVPGAVYSLMKEVRYEDFLLNRGFGEEKCEYFSTDLREWKQFINEELHTRLNELYGISIHFYGYDDEPPMIILDA
jgi:hypothetical protein